MSRYHVRGDAPGSNAEPGFMFVPHKQKNQLVLDEKAGIGVFGPAFKSADVYLQKGFTVLRVPNAEIKRLIKQRVWMDPVMLHPAPPGESDA